MRNTRAAILDNALAAFSERGYSATSMSDLRRATGASTGSLYHHFPSKEHVAAALWLDTLTAFQAGFVEAVEGGRGARGAVHAGVRFHLRWVEEHPDRARLLGAELEPAVLALVHERLGELNRVFFGRLRSWYETQVERGRVRQLPADVVHALWLGPAQELTRGWLSGRSAVAPRAAADALARGAWAALRP